MTARSYAVSFETKDPKTGKDHAGFVKYVKVTIEEEILAPEETVRVDLAADPLYAQLRQYVLSNLPR